MNIKLSTKQLLTYYRQAVMNFEISPAILSHCMSQVNKDERFTIGIISIRASMQGSMLRVLFNVLCCWLFKRTSV